MWKDDITGELGAEPYHFAVRGCVVDVDLTPENQARLLNLLAPFIRAGRITSKPGAVPSEVRAILNDKTTPAIEARPDEDFVVVDEEDAPVTAKAEYTVVKKAVTSEGDRRLEGDKPHTPKQRREIRAWIEVNCLRNMPAKGRKPQDVWEAFLANDLSLLKTEHRPRVKAAPRAIAQAG